MNKAVKETVLDKPAKLEEEKTKSKISFDKKEDDKKEE